jgi:hypothetical protein
MKRLCSPSANPDYTDASELTTEPPADHFSILSGWEGGKAQRAPAQVQAAMPLNMELNFSFSQMTGWLDVCGSRS